MAVADNNFGFVPKQAADNFGFIPKAEPTSAKTDLGFVPKTEPETEPESGTITEQELSDISSKHKLTKEQKENLASHANFFGTSIKGREDSMLSEAGGFLSDAIGLGIPQKAMIEFADTEQEKNALDDLRQLAEKRKSGLRTVAEIGAGFVVPGLGAAKVAKLGAKGLMAAGAATGAVESATRSKRGEELEGAVIGGTLGAAVGGIGAGAQKLIKKIRNPDIKKSITDIDNDTVEDVLDKNITQRAPQTAVEQKILKGEDLTEEDALKFLGKVPPDMGPFQYAKLKTDDLTDKFEKYTKSSLEDVRKQGNVDQLYEKMLREDMLEEAITDVNLRQNIVPMAELKKLAFKFSDMKPLSKVIDSRIGTKTEAIIENLSNQTKQYKMYLGHTLKDVNSLRKLTRKANVNQEDLFHALDTGDTSKVPTEVVNKWRNWFEEQRKFANEELGFNIPRIKNYVTHRRLTPVKYQTAINKQIKKIEDNYGVNILKLEQSDFDKLSEKSQSFKNLVNEIKFSSGLNNINKVEDLSFNINQMRNNPGFLKEKLTLDANTAKARTGEIPDFVLDKNVSNLATKWLQGTMRSGYLREGLNQLDLSAKLADKAGDDFSHKILQDLRLDIIGTRKDTLAAQINIGNAANKLLVHFNRKADEATNPFKKMVYEGAADAPLIMNTLMQQIYPNVMGMNPKNVIQNVMSLPFHGVPDLGLRYGTGKYLASNYKIAQTLANGMEIRLTPAAAKMAGKNPGEVIKTRNLELILANENLLPPQWKAESVEALREGIKSSAVGDMTRSALDKSTRGLMYFFEKSEQLARANALFMGKSMGSDIIRDPKFANKFIKKIDSPVDRKALIRAINDSNEEDAQKIMVNYLNSNYLFNYDRVNMSPYGRYMGPLFSMFSKWPTHIAGRMASQWERDGIKEGSRKILTGLVAPWVALKAADQAIFDEKSDIHKKLFGAKGPSSAAAFDAIIPLGQEGIMRSPVLSEAGAIGKALTGGGSKEINRALQDAVSRYAPGAGWLRLIGEDIPIYSGKRKPKGPKIERQIDNIIK